MDNATINEMKRFLKQHQAYCSFNCIPLVTTDVNFSLHNGVFKKLFVGEDVNTHRRLRELKPVTLFLGKKALEGFNSVISEADVTPEFIIVMMSGVSTEVQVESVEEIMVRTFTASSCEETKRIIKENFDPTTVFMVKHYLPASARDIYQTLIDKKFGVNITKRKNFDGHRFEATVNTYSLGHVPKGYLQDVCGIFERSFPTCKFKFLLYSTSRKSSTWSGVETIRFKFDRISELNRLKLYEITKEIPLNVNVSIDALLGEND